MLLLGILGGAIVELLNRHHLKIWGERR